MINKIESDKPNILEREHGPHEGFENIEHPLVFENALGLTVFVGLNQRLDHLVHVTAWSHFDAEVLQILLEDVEVLGRVDNEVYARRTLLDSQRCHLSLVIARSFVHVVVRFLCLVLELDFRLNEITLEHANVDNRRPVLAAGERL